MQICFTIIQIFLRLHCCLLPSNSFVLKLPLVFYLPACLFPYLQRPFHHICSYKPIPEAKKHGFQFGFKAEGCAKKAI